MKRSGNPAFHRWQRRLQTAFETATPAQQVRAARLVSDILLLFQEPERVAVCWHLKRRSYPIVIVSGIQTILVNAGWFVKVEYSPDPPGSWSLTVERPPYE